MAYHAEAIESMEDAIAAMKSFAETQMWTINSSSQTTLSLSKGATHVYIRKPPTQDSLQLSISPDYDSARTFDSQLNQSTWVAIAGWFPRALSMIHFFSGTDYITAVIESSNGYFQHILFGQIVKAGVWEGGVYLATPTQNAQFPVNFYVRAPWRGSGHWVNSFYSFNFLWDFNGSLTQTGMDLETGVTPLIPVWVFASDSVGYPNPAYLGYLPGMRRCSRQARSPGDEITLGSDVWKIFPTLNKADTGLHAVAYKK